MHWLLTKEIMYVSFLNAHLTNHQSHGKKTTTLILVVNQGHVSGEM